MVAGACCCKGLLTLMGSINRKIPLRCMQSFDSRGGATLCCSFAIVISQSLIGTAAVCGLFGNFGRVAVEWVFLLHPAETLKDVKAVYCTCCLMVATDMCLTSRKTQRGWVNGERTNFTVHRYVFVTHKVSFSSNQSAQADQSDFWLPVRSLQLQASYSEGDISCGSVAGRSGLRCLTNS